jgi:molybdopterin/thiamine biosynthesis adenylyltransferase
MREALDRTLLLMRTELVDEVTDDELMAALTGTRVMIAADAVAAATHSGQSAIVAAAMNMARSGHEVWLWLEDAALAGPQPPLTGSTLLEGLLDVGEDLLPGWRFRQGAPDGEVDLLVVFGRTDADLPARQKICLNAGPWSARLAPVEEGTGWTAGDWPIGALAAAAVAAAEAFKAAMRKLEHRARSSVTYRMTHAPAERADIELAPEDTGAVGNLATFDIVSAGAIANALLFTLHRLPGAVGSGRVMDDDESAESNLNRNALLRRSGIGLRKVDDLAGFSKGIAIEPLGLRYGRTTEELVPLAANVLLGVDDIPSRWKVQQNVHGWLGIGATDRFSVQVSWHLPGLPCAGCVHPESTPSDGPIPTAAFVSFWSGLLLAVAFLRSLGASPPPASRQQIFFSPLRPESWEFAASGVSAREDCPVCSGQGAQ